MEPVGFAIGVVALASLFDTCVNLADRIKLASNLGKDYEISYTRFLLLKSRLNAWGTALKVLADDSSADQDTKDRWHEERILIGRALTAINYLLEDATNLDKKYGLHQVSEVNESVRNLHSGHSTSLQEVEEGLDAGIKLRQKKTSGYRKFTWAVGDKKKFDELIANLSAFVSELELLATRLNAPPSNQIKESIETIHTPAALQLLQAATDSPQLQVAPNGADQNLGHMYIHNLVTQQALVVTGDVDMGRLKGGNHRYAGNEITGGKVVMGNMSGDFAARFFGL